MELIDNENLDDYDQNCRDIDIRDSIKCKPDIDRVLEKGVNDLRRKIMNYEISKEITQEESDHLDMEKIPQSTNIIIFGPSGSGKSSLIKSMSIALHNTLTLSKE